MKGYSFIQQKLQLHTAVTAVSYSQDCSFIQHQISYETQTNVTLLRNETTSKYGLNKVTENLPRLTREYCKSHEIIFSRFLEKTLKMLILDVLYVYSTTRISV